MPALGAGAGRAHPSQAKARSARPSVKRPAQKVPCPQGKLRAEAASCRGLLGVGEAHCADQAPKRPVSGTLTQTLPNLVPEVWSYLRLH